MYDILYYRIQMMCIFSFEIHKYIFRLVQNLYIVYIICIMCIYYIHIIHITIYVLFARFRFLVYHTELFRVRVKYFIALVLRIVATGKQFFTISLPFLTPPPHRHRSGVFLEGTRLTPTRVSRGNTTSDHWPPPSPPGPRDIN